MTATKTSPAGRAAIRQREGCVLTAYQDTKGIWTIGVGHTGLVDGVPVRKGMQITAQKADELLVADLATAETAILKAVRVPLSQGQFDALVSLTFNIGAKAFTGSTVARRLNAGDYAGAADAILMWNKPAELKGRREAEKAQFLAAGPALVAVAPSAALGFWASLARVFGLAASRPIG